MSTIGVTNANATTIATGSVFSYHYGMRNPESILRLRKKHDPGKSADVDVQALIADQSLGRAIGGAAIAMAVLSALWVYASFALDSFYPWFSMIEGVFIGRAVRHFGNGIDWRFPVLAAGATVVAAWLGSFVSALVLSSREMYTPAWELMTEIGWHTISTFTTQTFGTVGTIYAVTGALIAAFFAKRRLDRNEAIALRKFREAAQS